MSLCGLCGDKHDGVGWCPSCHDTFDESKPFEVDHVPPGPDHGTLMIYDYREFGVSPIKVGKGWSDDTVRRRGSYTKQRRTWKGGEQG